MMRYIKLLVLLLSSPVVVAHPGHGNIPFDYAFTGIVVAVLLASAGQLGYRRYRNRRKPDKSRKRD